MKYFENMDIISCMFTDYYLEIQAYDGKHVQTVKFSDIEEYEIVCDNLKMFFSLHLKYSFEGFHIYERWGLNLWRLS